MAQNSSIEWTEVTWNPVTGCTKISAGCRSCYAERMANRLKAIGVKQYEEGFKLKLAPHVLHAPYSWKKQKVVFVNSMSDLFHEDVPLEYIKAVFAVMNNTSHIYQVLTKRAERLAEVHHELTWTENIWMGVSVENQLVSNRVDNLLKTNAQVKFLSIEPLIGPIGKLPLRNIDWVIVGGESGPRARPLKLAWVENIRQQCEKTYTPFFFKQWGKPKFNVDPLDPTIAKSHPLHAKGGCQLNGKVYRQMPVTG